MDPNGGTAIIACGDATVIDSFVVMDAGSRCKNTSFARSQRLPTAEVSQNRSPAGDSWTPAPAGATTGSTDEIVAAHMQRTRIGIPPVDRKLENVLRVIRLMRRLEDSAALSELVRTVSEVPYPFEQNLEHSASSGMVLSRVAPAITAQSIHFCPQEFSDATSEIERLALALEADSARILARRPWLQRTGWWALSRVAEAFLDLAAPVSPYLGEDLRAQMGWFRASVLPLLAYGIEVSIASHVQISELFVDALRQGCSEEVETATLEDDLAAWVDGCGPVPIPGAFSDDDFEALQRIEEEFMALQTKAHRTLAKATDGPAPVGMTKKMWQDLRSTARQMSVLRRRTFSTVKSRSAETRNRVMSTLRAKARGRDGPREATEREVDIPHVESAQSYWCNVAQSQSYVDLFYVAVQILAERAKDSAMRGAHASADLGRSARPATAFGASERVGAPLPRAEQASTPAEEACPDAPESAADSAPARSGAKTKTRGPATVQRSGTKRPVQDSVNAILAGRRILPGHSVLQVRDVLVRAFGEWKAGMPPIATNWRALCDVFEVQFGPHFGADDSERCVAMKAYLQSGPGCVFSPHPLNVDGPLLEVWVDGRKGRRLFTVGGRPTLLLGLTKALHSHKEYISELQKLTR